MHNYYIKDISNLPTPLTRPTNTNIKGVNQLGFVGFFEDNHKFTKKLMHIILEMLFQNSLINVIAFS